MTWSTRQLAEIAGTTVNTVRYYHQSGLLPEPERAANGYKQYSVTHLLRLLHIKRLRDVGVTVVKIAAVDADDGDALELIRAIDADLEAAVDRLSRARAELAVLLSHRAPVESPPRFADLTGELTPRQRSLLSIYAAIFDSATQDAFRDALLERDPTETELDALSADADDTRVDDLARRMVPVVLRQRQTHPRLNNAVQTSPLGPAAAQQTLAHAYADLYNPAQLRTLHRLGALLAQHDDRAGPSRPDRAAGAADLDA